MLTNILKNYTNIVTERRKHMENGILDKLQDVMIVAGREVESTAKKLTEKAKLKYEIHTREGYLNELYIELGKKYYTEHKDDAEEDSEAGESFTEIDNLLDELRDLRAELEELKGVRHCERCGAQVPKDADYCNKCGEYMGE